MEESIIRDLCSRISSLETMVKMHIESEWKLWAFLGSIALAIVINILQGRNIHKEIKNGRCKKDGE